MKKFTSPEKAVEELIGLYGKSTEKLKDSFNSFVTGKLPSSKQREFYPLIRISTKDPLRNQTGKSWGFLEGAGVFETTVTRPELFSDYLVEQLDLIMKAHDAELQIGCSETAIPVHFALGEDFQLDSTLEPERAKLITTYFDRPDLNHIDDDIANCRVGTLENGAYPLSLFDGPRTDLSLLRIKHYTGTSPEHFQKYVIFTNYQFYIDKFVEHSLNALEEKGSGYSELIKPGNISVKDRASNQDGNLKRQPQMPAFHIKRPDNQGISIINIGVGPSNAKNISDHLAVLRPHAWIMLGHCAGLRTTQNLGDYVLAHGYYRDDNILDRELDPSIPIPALSEIQLALEASVSEVTGLTGRELKKIMRTGTVATVDDRNWELRADIKRNTRLSQSRAIALDMESGTIAANGFRLRVPYGTFLCVSDKPLHGELKLPGMAESFYRSQVEKHLRIGLVCMEKLRETGIDKLHSRKLRSFKEVAFR